MVRGLSDRRVIDVLIGAVMALCFAYQFSVLLPHQGIGWQAHIGGLAGGILSGWLLRDKRAAKAPAAARTKADATPAVTPAQIGAARSPTGTVAVPGAGAALPTTKAGKPVKVDPANPRADLYKELDDLGLWPDRPDQPPRSNATVGRVGVTAATRQRRCTHSPVGP